LGPLRRAMTVAGISVCTSDRRRPAGAESGVDMTKLGGPARRTSCQLVELPVPRTWGTDGLRALAREACRRRASKGDRGILADGWEYVEGHTCAERTCGVDTGW
jgi:hypothetical protein